MISRQYRSVHCVVAMITIRPYRRGREKARAYVNHRIRRASKNVHFFFFCFPLLVRFFLREIRRSIRRGKTIPACAADWH